MSQDVYCVCRGPDDGSFMLLCDACSDWFHGRCVGVAREQVRHAPNARGAPLTAAPQAKNLSEFYCDACCAIHGRPPNLDAELALPFDDEFVPDIDADGVRSSASESDASASDDARARAAAARKRRKRASTAAAAATAAAPTPAADAAAVRAPPLSSRRCHAHVSLSLFFFFFFFSSFIAFVLFFLFFFFFTFSFRRLRALTRDAQQQKAAAAKRETVRRNLAAALGGALADDSALAEADVARVAAAVEASLFQLFEFAASAAYVAKARSLMYNLRANAALRQSVARCHVSPHRLCTMDTKVRCGSRGSAVRVGSRATR